MTQPIGREPTPDRVLSDTGTSFAIGILGSTFFHLFKGALNSPRGERFAGGLQSVRMNAPQTGGAFAMWGVTYSTCDCALVALRNKEDPWNSILAGALTGGLMSLRLGLRAASRSAFFTAALFALAEGANISVLQPMIAEASKRPPGREDNSDHPLLRKTNEGEVDEMEMVDVLERFDSPTPMPTFENS